MRAAFEYFKAFDRQDAEDNRKFATHKLPMPVFVITGDKSLGGVPEVQAKIVADNVTAIKLHDLHLFVGVVQAFQKTPAWRQEDSALSL